MLFEIIKLFFLLQSENVDLLEDAFIVDLGLLLDAGELDLSARLGSVEFSVRSGSLDKFLGLFVEYLLLLDGVEPVELLLGLDHHIELLLGSESLCTLELFSNLLSRD